MLKLVTISSFDIPTAGTRKQLSTTSILVDRVYVAADPANTGSVYLGDENVSSIRGIPIRKTDVPFVLESEQLSQGGSQGFDLKDLWLDCGTNGDNAMVSYIVRA